MRPKRWREFQNYHDGRTIVWVKNYVRLDMPGSDFRKLSWADQGRLQALWRLAARLGNDGMIPYDERYVRAALGDKRFPIVSQMVTNWFHIGTQTELKRAAKRENPSRALVPNVALEVRSKKKKELTRAVPVVRHADPHPPAGEQPPVFTIRNLVDQSLKEAS